ncbi:phage tail terminator protein [Paracoccus sp. 22332]|uniref:phage tail terminator protein n=1 Tax=Paracoccus sp. 22332 TaxID=3453913 RepID=UPI003F8752B7
MIHARLTAQLPSSRWNAVEICEDIDTFGDRAGQVETGTALVMPWNERATSQTLLSGGTRQLVTTQFAVGMVVRAYDHMLGADRAVQFDTLKSDIETALAGWEPAGFAQPCELVGGESSPVSKGVSIYVQTWATARFLTRASA